MIIFSLMLDEILIWRCNYIQNLNILFFWVQTFFKMIFKKVSLNQEKKIFRNKLITALRKIWKYFLICEFLGLGTLTKFLKMCSFLPSKMYLIDYLFYNLIKWVASAHVLNSIPRCQIWLRSTFNHPILSVLKESTK